MITRKPFIKIGTRHLSLDHIIEIDINYRKYSHQDAAVVRVVTTQLEVGEDGSFSAEIFYPHGTPEAHAVMAWLEGQSEDLLASRFYITSNLYGGHVAYLADAARTCNAQLLAVDYQDIQSLPQDQQGYRENRAYYLFSVPATTLQEARDLVERIEAEAGERMESE